MAPAIFSAAARARSSWSRIAATSAAGIAKSIPSASAADEPDLYPSRTSDDART